MTEIDVPDWVVEVAMAAGEQFASENTASMYATVRDLRREEMRTSITAALGAWVVQAGYLNKWEDGDETVSARPAHPEDGLAQPLYTLRQEKPE